MFTKLGNLKIILGIETSCDETSAAVITKTDNSTVLLSNIVSSSMSIQSKYGGVIPEQAAREQIKVIIPVIQEALEQSQMSWQDIDAIAVTQGPGLIGSLLVGVEAAKTLSLVQNKPLIAVNHLIAHFYANWINTNPDISSFKVPQFPIIGLLISGGHTDLILMKDHQNYIYLGGTRDDATGETFDKTARFLELPYPGGPNLSKLAQIGNPKAFDIPRPMLDSDDYDFSFSGLKTSVLNIVKNKKGLSKQEKMDLAASIEQAIVDVLVKKTVNAAQDNDIKQIMVAGGVAANQRFRQNLQASFDGQIFIPPINLCTDNAAMIAAVAFYQPNFADPLNLQADPNLTLN